MNATKYLSLAALALMGTLTSCQSDEDSFAAQRPSDAVNVNVQVGSLQTTRTNPMASTAADQQKFNAGDQVSISATDQEAVVYQLGESGWTEAVAGKFLLWKSASLEFQAYYPVTDGTSMTAFTLPADQSTEAKIAAADYMTKTETIARPTSGTDITLELERKMARVIINISSFSDQYADDEKQVSNVKIFSGAAGYAESAATGSVTEVTPYVDGQGGVNTKYYALVVPSTANATANFVTLTDGESKSQVVKGIPAMEAGKSYTFNLVVGKNKIEVASVTVTDWTGETLTGGQAQEQTAATARALVEATAEDLGKIAGADGNIYDSKDAAETAGTTAVAMITYVGSGNDLAIAIALSDENGVMSWANAKSVCEGKSAVTGAAWILPTLEQWGKVFGDVDSANGLNSAIVNAGGTALEDNADYWTSTESSDGKVNTVFITGGSWTFHETETQSNGKARACLAFPTGEALVSNNGAESLSPFGSAGNPLNQ